MRNLGYAALGLFLFLIGCNIQDIDLNKIKIENFQNELAVPFGTASYTMRELIEDVSDPDLILEEDPETAELMITYQETGGSYTLSSDIFDVPDISNPSTVSLPATPASGFTVIINESSSFFQVYESVDGEIIDSVFHADNSSLEVQVESTNPVDVSYTMTLTNTINLSTDNPVSFSGAVGGGSMGNHIQNLMNHKTVFTEVNGENRFNVDITLDITVDPGESIAAGDEITITIEFLDQDFIIVFGKLGQDTVAFSGQTIDIAFFDDFGIDGFEFGSPEISLDFRSSFGIPIGVGLGGIYGEESDGSRTYLSGEIVSTPPVIESSSIVAPVTGEVQQTTISINSTNSTLQQMLATSPSTIGFEVDGFTNPYDQSILNFVTDTSTIRSFIEVTLPMEVRLTDVQHNLDFDLGGGVDFSDADSLTLRMTTVNEFPFGATLDMYILNAAEDTLYTVLEKNALGSPTLNHADKTIVEPKTSIDDIPFNKTGIDALNNGTTIRIVITMNTTPSGTAEDIFVKLLATAKLDITLAARGTIDVKL
ncbi:MAG: hypothetical protein GY816_19945 [Cytophagales bacterium]|nr:hypothetical protein [Cytophagales bacterium]